MMTTIRTSLSLILMLLAGCGDVVEPHEEEVLALNWFDGEHAYRTSWVRWSPGSEEWIGVLTILSMEGTGPKLRWVASLEEAAYLDEIVPSTFAPFAAESCGGHNIVGAPEYSCNLFSEYVILRTWFSVGFEGVATGTPLDDTLENVRELIRDVARFGTPDSDRSTTLWESGDWPPPSGT